MLKLLTFTGADDTVDPEQLFAISAEHPFVEWGILYSKKQIGTPRFPSVNWLEMLAQDYYSLPQDKSKDLNLSLHLCGHFVRQFVIGVDEFAQALGDDMLSMFKRVQINTHGETHTWDVKDLALMIGYFPEHQFIFQLDGNGQNEAMAKMLWLEHELPNVAYLFDTSHGAGITRKVWPNKHLSKCMFGYAGGLGPDNMEAELPEIIKAAQNGGSWNNEPIWIDMETKVRTEDGKAFDLEKVKHVIGICRHAYVGQRFPVSPAVGEGPGPDHIMKPPTTEQ